jgi:putative tryptophan/tyrosine transport system substrate-binding protein
MQFTRLKRREVIALLGGATAWPLAARAQQPERMRRIGVLMSTGANDPEGQSRLAAFMQGLQEFNWAVGRNVEIDIRWTASNADNVRKYAAELVALAPDVILVSGGSLVGPLLQQTRTVPVVFTLTPDPVGAGFVTSLARPGGNATGFTSTEYGMSAKWLELLKEIAPRVTRAAVLRDPAIAQGIGQFAVMQSAASPLAVELSPVNMQDAPEIERAITEFARSSNGGIIVPASGLALLHRDLIISLAVRHKLPAVYFLRAFVREGGLISYGADSIDPHRRAAGYVNRILKGEKPADLPVQNPTKYELAINLKTAKTLSLDIPPTLLALADEVIE